MAKITLSDVAKDNAKIVGYLLVSGGLGYVLAEYVAKDAALTAVFAPAINYVLWLIEKELKGEGVVTALKNK
jgi:hypothetical protein